jgi:hypothetical protein
VTSGVGLYKNNYVCEAVPRAGLNPVFRGVKACSIYLSVFGIVSHHILWLWGSLGKKEAGGHFEKWNVVFCFSKCLPKSYTK